MDVSLPVHLMMNSTKRQTCMKFCIERTPGCRKVYPTPINFCYISLFAFLLFLFFFSSRKLNEFLVTAVLRLQRTNNFKKRTFHATVSNQVKKLFSAFHLFILTLNSTFPPYQTHRHCKNLFNQLCKCPT